MTAPTALGVGGSGTLRRVLGAVLVVGLLAGVAAYALSLRDPASFRNRTSLHTCGSVESSRTGIVPPEAVRCLEAAGRSGQGAELQVTLLTDEGDPVESYYRALPTGGVEIFTDNTQDAYGSRAWLRELCAESTGIPEPGACLSVPV